MIANSARTAARARRLPPVRSKKKAAPLPERPHLPGRPNRPGAAFTWTLAALLALKRARADTGRRSFYHLIIRLHIIADAAAAGFLAMMVLARRAVVPGSHERSRAVSALSGFDPWRTKTQHVPA